MSISFLFPESVYAFGWENRPAFIIEQSRVTFFKAKELVNEGPSIAFAAKKAEPTNKFIGFGQLPNHRGE